MILLAFCLFILNLFAGVEECSISQVPGELLGCALQDEEINIELIQNAVAVKDTVCVLETQFSVSHYRCNGTDWNQEEIIRNEKHSRKKRGWWRRFTRGVDNFFKGVFHAAVCVATLFSCLWSGRAGHSDTIPPNINCATPYIAVTAEPYQIYAKASWPEPTAHDEIDGNITPRRKSGRPSGRHFPEGETEVVYEAKDRAGNRASCLIRVNVTVIRCDEPKHIDNGYFQCHPVTEFLNGGTCHFGCYEGFDLHGASQMKCLEIGKWSKAQPVCKPWKCNGLSRIDGAGYPSCDNNFYFRSICTYNCKRGFDMPPKVSKALVCDKTKTWRKFGEPKCIDVEPPVFNPSSCPSVVIKGTDEGTNSTNVTWNLPEVTDNSNRTIIFENKRLRGARLMAGTYTVKYEAKDAQGNMAVNDCSFQVVVREIRCPRLYPTPYLNIDCPHGYRSGARCDLSCDPGKELIGTNDVKCERKNNELFGDWMWKDQQQSVCKNGKKCVNLPPPKNGVIACDNWEGGQYCQVQCKNGTAMSSVSLNKLYICLPENGEWSETIPGIRTCRETRHHHVQHTIGITIGNYFNGDCTDPKTRAQIANNFIAALRNSPFDEACPDPKTCSAGNVQITCGESSRRRRDVNSTSSTTLLEIRFQLPVSLNGNESFVTLEKTKQSIMHAVEVILRENSTEIFNETSNSTLQISSSGFSIHYPTGSVKSEESWNCIDCPEGSFYVKSSTKTYCEACRKGTYQDKTAQLLCKRCPIDKTTQSVGAKAFSECEDACRPGSYSRDGLYPCSPCERGYYQPSYGKTTCKPCRSSRSTLTVGTISASQCEDFDIQLAPGERSSVIFTMQKEILINEFTIAFWMQNSVDNDTLLPTLTFQDNQNNVTWAWQNLKTVNRLNNVDTDAHLESPNTRWHHVTLYNSPTCRILIKLDGLQLPTEQYTGDCASMTVKTVTIDAGKTTNFAISQLNIWNYKYDFGYTYRCSSKDVGNIIKWKDFEEAELSGAYFNLPSVCDDFNNCVSSPCIHGTCSDALHGFTCKCDTGYRGTQCDVNIDDCENNICMNDATCMDGVANYTCLCPANYTGQFCEIKMVDGGWSEWGNWSECSTTCGDGEMKRKRLCNSPSPDNGGMYCQGNTLDFQNCNNTECPVCPQIYAPSNGSVDCINDTESINCTIACDDGFDFDIEPLPLYYCGPETFNEWNFQTDENQDRRLPRCVAIKLPDVLKVTYTAHYRDLFCANEDLEDLAKEQIDNTVNAVLSNIICLQQQTCNLSYVNVIDCDNNKRNRRSAVTAGFTLQITSTPSEENKNETLGQLEKAFQDIQDAADNGQMTVDVLDDDYELDGNRTDLSGEVICQSGYTRVNFYCVPCGQGAYLYTDYCEPCPVGTYQDQEGQTSCHICPKGKSTIGIRSTSISDCSVDKVNSLEDGLKVTGIIVGCVCAVVVLVVAFFVYRRYKMKTKKLTNVSDITMATRSVSSLSTDSGKLGPSNKKFEPHSLTDRNTPDSVIRAKTFENEAGEIVHGKPWR